MLNVLPNDKRALLYYENWFLIVRQVCIILVITFVTVAVITYGSHVILTTWYSTLAINTTSTANIDAAKAQELTTTVQQLHQLTTGLKTAGNSWHNPLPVVATIVRELPEHTSLAALELNYTNNQLHLTGIVADRTAIALLQDHFSQLAIEGYTLGKSQFYVSDLTLKTNIPFTFNTSLTPIDSL